jgi:hypothetical protein
MLFRATPVALAALFAVAVACPGVFRSALADENAAILAPIYERFAAENVGEVPSMQRHVLPMMGRLGCNGRACHGSFQGRGGFQLSLFGYDFEADHAAMTDDNAGRVLLDLPEESLIVTKPTDESLHEGGKRFEAGGWEQRVLLRWVEAGAPFDKQQVDKLVELSIEPQELIFGQPGETRSLKAIAVWEDGSREDVTSLCRFQTNDESVAAIDAEGAVTSVGKGDTHVVVFYDKAVVPIPTMMAVSDLAGDKYPQVDARTIIDKLAIEKLSKLGVLPSGVCDDATFLRRVRLDLTGTLPSTSEVETFLADTSADKRQKKIDELLETPEYAAWWATKFSDWTGNNDRQLNSTFKRGGSSKEWYDWLVARLRENAPYDQMVEQILVADAVEGEEEYRDWCSEGSARYRDESQASFGDQESMPYFWARQNVRAKEDKTIAVAYSFLGIRIQCAQCHKHPFDQWSKDDFQEFTKFFERVNYRTAGAGPLKPVYEEILKEAGFEPGKLKGNDLQKKLPETLSEGKVVPMPYIGIDPLKKIGATRKDKKGKTVREQKVDPKQSQARLLGGELVDLQQVDDPRQPVMEWLRDPANPYFAKSIANRIWANYFHRGLVEPADDLNLANPPSNAAILDHLATGFVQSGFDLKWLHREICNSDTYQRAWETNETNVLDDRNFSHAVLRRLPAETAYDAVYLASLSDDVRDETAQDLGKRAISFAGVQNGGDSKASAFALAVFGKSLREQNCDCDRSAEPNLLQTCFLQNDQEALAMIDQKGGWISELERRWGAAGDGSEARQGEGRKQSNLQAQLDKAKKALRAAEKQKDKAKAKRARKQVEGVEAQIAAFQAARQETVEAARTDVAGELERTIEVAYLRTLSRYPNDEERAVSREFIAQSEDPGDGVRGLLWALINTKEFIVNH